MAKGMTFIIAGPSGVGKGSVIKKVFESGRKLYFSVSATTRAPRPGERDGVDYHFISYEQFQSWIAEGAFLEHAEFVGNCYGTPKRYVDEAMDRGEDVILDIEVQGAEQIHRLRPEAVRIFLAPPSWAELRRRLTGRGTESEEKVEKRLQRSREEFQVAREYDYLVVNDNLEQAAAEVLAIIAASHCRAEDRYEAVRRTLEAQ
ncbi:MAG: guanylate kinase [Oscillospiraceae bacterium]|jgi:guanylate kinase|nr:guanylate kinase [Oscillospiraceae bacterium]MCI9586531.1 guanylate kinase [Oscillospiraceae bacterium]